MYTDEHVDNFFCSLRIIIILAPSFGTNGIVVVKEEVIGYRHAPSFKKLEPSFKDHVS